MFVVVVVVGGGGVVVVCCCCCLLLVVVLFLSLLLLLLLLLFVVGRCFIMSRSKGKVNGTRKSNTTVLLFARLCLRCYGLLSLFAK